jgi:hypothetical protein
MEDPKMVPVLMTRIEQNPVVSAQHPLPGPLTTRRVKSRWPLPRSATCSLAQRLEFNFIFHLFNCLQHRFQFIPLKTGHHPDASTSDDHSPDAFTRPPTQNPSSSSTYFHSLEPHTSYSPLEDHSPLIRVNIGRPLP